MVPTFLFLSISIRMSSRTSHPAKHSGPYFLSLEDRFNLWYRPIFGAGRLIVLLLIAISYLRVDVVIHISGLHLLVDLFYCYFQPHLYKDNVSFSGDHLDEFVNVEVIIIV
jgi:hypothetical protein